MFLYDCLMTLIIKWVYIKLLVIAQFKLVPVNWNVKAVKGKTLSLERKINDISESNVINNVILYYDIIVPASLAIIYTWDVSNHILLVTATSASMFGRISASIKWCIYKLVKHVLLVR